MYYKLKLLELLLQNVYNRCMMFIKFYSRLLLFRKRRKINEFKPQSVNINGTDVCYFDQLKIFIIISSFS